MQEAESSSITTTVQAIIKEFRGGFCYSADKGEHKLLKLAENSLPNKYNAVYLVAYFLSVSLYYLVISLLRQRYIQCALECSSEDLSCKCELNNSIPWSTASYVELSWVYSRIQKDSLESVGVNVVSINNHQTQSILQTKFEIQVSCFPTICSAFVGITEQFVAVKSIFSISFSQQIPFDNRQNPLAIFRAVNPTYPQLSTTAQLSTNLVFTIFTVIFCFFGKGMSQKQNIHIKNAQKRNHLDQRDHDAQIPAQIQQLNNQLQVHRMRAVRFLLSPININILSDHLYHLYQQ